MAVGSIKDRLAALEAEVAELKRQIQVKDGASWRRVIGSFANDPLYDQAMEYGRQYRESQRPGKRKKRKPRNGDS